MQLKHQDLELSWGSVGGPGTGPADLARGMDVAVPFLLLGFPPN